MYILPITLFVTITLLMTAAGLAVRDVRNSHRQTVELRLGPAWSSEVDLLFSEPRLRPDGRKASGLLRPIDDWWEKLVAQSGTEWSPIVGLLSALASGLLTGGLLFLWSDHVLLGAAGWLVGALAVIGYLQYRRMKRSELLMEQIPDAISLMSRSIRAGETLEQSLELLGDHTDEPLAIEFRRCARHLGMGLSVDATMRALMRRVPLLEIQILASTLIVQRRAGGDLPATLENLVYVIRDRLSYHRQFQASTAASRLSTMIIGVMGPALAIGAWLWRPNHYDMLLGTPQGRALLTLSICLYVGGLIWARSHLRPDY